MKTIYITKADLNKDNYYKEDGIGFDGPDFDGSVEIAEGLGYVKFKKGVYVTGSIVAKAGSGIEAGEGIEAGSGIKAGEGIQAGYGIKAGSGIKAGEGIQAGYGIKAGWGIEAGEGIKAGEGIVCELSLSFSYKLFAGTAPWTNSATKTVTCGKLLKGTIAYGDLIETGMPEEVKETDATSEAIALLKSNGYEIIKKEV